MTIDYITASERGVAQAGHSRPAGSHGTHQMVSLADLPPGMDLVPLSKCRHGGVIGEPAAVTCGSSTDDTHGSTQFEHVVAVDDIVGVAPSTAPAVLDAYAALFGDFTVACDLMDDGTFLVTNGAHVVAGARQMGLTHIPARVTFL